MCGRSVRYQTNEAKRYGKLDDHVYSGHERMAYLQFVGHQLIGVFPVCLSEILVQHDTVAYGQAAIGTIYQQQYEPGNVPGLHDRG